MERERISLVICVNLDPIPGAFHTAESAQYHIQDYLNHMIPHYDPVVMPGTLIEEGP